MKPPNSQGPLPAVDRVEVNVVVPRGATLGVTVKMGPSNEGAIIVEVKPHRCLLKEVFCGDLGREIWLLRQTRRPEVTR